MSDRGYNTGYFYSDSNAVCNSQLSLFVSSTIQMRPYGVNEQDKKMMNTVEYFKMMTHSRIGYLHIWRANTVAKIKT